MRLIQRGQQEMSQVKGANVVDCLSGLQASHSNCLQTPLTCVYQKCGTGDAIMHMAC